MTRQPFSVFSTRTALKSRARAAARVTIGSSQTRPASTGGGAIFCIPAQQTIPLLVRWMLVFEDNDKDTLHLGRAIPRDWVAIGKPIAIEKAPTRYGQVSYRLETRGDELVATVALSPTGKLPKELHVTFRAPKSKSVSGVTVNGKAGRLGGTHGDSAVITPAGARHFEVVAKLA